MTSDAFFEFYAGVAGRAFARDEFLSHCIS